jgi:hypothetical protein
MNFKRSFKNAILSVVAISFSTSILANTLLTCSDASAPSNRGYFPTIVELLSNQGNLSVRMIQSPLVNVLTNEHDSAGNIFKVLETITIGNTSNYVLEKSESGDPSIVLVADLEAKSAVIMYYGKPANISIAQFLKCK